jgi:hypothetical protein
MGRGRGEIFGGSVKTSSVSSERFRFIIELLLWGNRCIIELLLVADWPNAAVERGASWEASLKLHSALKQEAKSQL